MTEIAIQYPWKYRDVFEELVDFHVIDASIGGGHFTTSKRVWYDLSQGIAYESELGVDGVIAPTCEKPDRNLLNIARFKTHGESVIGIWRGERRHLRLLEECCDIVALPYFTYGRMLNIDPLESSKYHLYEFCNLDELRRYPVRSIHTSVPITAALMGIDLRTRERRPKNLPPFRYDLELSDSQLELAVSNIKAIREAVSIHERQH